MAHLEPEVITESQQHLELRMADGKHVMRSGHIFLSNEEHLADCRLRVSETACT